MKDAPTRTVPRISLIHRGGFRVIRERVLESEHKTEREAIEAAIACKMRMPHAVVRVQADYEIDVEFSD